MERDLTAMRDGDIDLAAVLLRGLLILPGMEVLAGFEHDDLLQPFSRSCSRRAAMAVF
jgi:hypothetical protein